MKKVILTAYMIAKHNPPKPYFTWSEDAVKVWLEKQGFDLTKPIESTRELSSCSIIFRQRD